MMEGSGSESGSVYLTKDPEGGPKIYESIYRTLCEGCVVHVVR